MISFNAKHEIVYRASRPRVGSTESRPGGERDRERERFTYTITFLEMEFNLQINSSYFYWFYINMSLFHHE